MYRRLAIEDGLKRNGYVIGNGVPKSAQDLLVLWNRKAGRDDQEAALWEKRGGTVLVVENAFLQKVDKSAYAFSISEHHRGLLKTGTEDRFSRLGFEIKPWRAAPGGCVLVCAQRGIGSPAMASPPQWAEKLAAKLTQRGTPARVRPHPGNHAPKVPIERDLEGVAECHVWSSSAGIRALIEGIPVTHAAPYWICTHGLRETALQYMAHSQFSVAEIENGEPFARVLEAVKC